MTSAGLPAGVVLLCGCCTAPGSRQKKETKEEGGARRDPQYDPDVPHSVIAQVPVIALGADAAVPIALAVPRADPTVPTGAETLLAGTELTVGTAALCRRLSSGMWGDPHKLSEDVLCRLHRLLRSLRCAVLLGVRRLHRCSAGHFLLGAGATIYVWLPGAACAGRHEMGRAWGAWRR